MDQPDDRASLESILLFLVEHPPHRVVAGSYTVGDLVSDLAGWICANGACSCEIEGTPCALSHLTVA